MSPAPDGGWREGSSPPHAALAYTRASLGGAVYVTSVPARPYRCAGRAKRGRLPGHGWGGGLPLSLHSPHPAAGGWWVGWLVARMQAPGGGSPHELLEYWRAPHPRGAPWCVSWCARHADALRVAEVPPAATVSHSSVCVCVCVCVRA